MLGVEVKKKKNQEISLQELTLVDTVQHICHFHKPGTFETLFYHAGIYSILIQIPPDQEMLRAPALLQEGQERWHPVKEHLLLL